VKLKRNKNYRSILRSKMRSKSISCFSYHYQLEWTQYPYVWIFTILYLAWLYCYIQRLIFEFDEFFYLALGSIATLNAVTVLSCFWSLNMKVFLTCRKVKDLRKAHMVKVIPTAHKGSAALCPIVFHEVCPIFTIWHFNSSSVFCSG
jgi:cation-transporting ATPase 13A1